MAGVTGLEPAASGVTGRRSNQLSYTPNADVCPGVCSTVFVASNPKIQQKTSRNEKKMKKNRPCGL